MNPGSASDPDLPQASGEPRLFYGWWLVLLVSLVVVVTAVPFYQSMAVWAVALEKHFMWSRSHLSVPFTISRGFALLAPVVGYLTDRLGPRRLVLPGLCIVAAGFVVFGLMQDLWTFYFSSVTIAIGLQLCGSIPLVVMLSQWFLRRRAFAIAVYLAIPSGLALALVPMIAWSIDAGTDGPGWRPTAFIVAGAVAFVAAIAFLRMRDAPGDVDLEPDGNRDLPPAVHQTGFSLGQALRSRSFWFITVGSGLASAGLAAGDAAANWRGEEVSDLRLMAIVAVIASLVSVCFYLMGGLAGDRFTKHRLMAVFASVQALGVLLVVFAQGVPVVSLAMVLMSVGAGGLVPLSLAIMPDYFGTGSLGSILGVQGLIVGLVAGGASATYLFWPVPVGTGSYALALLAPLLLNLLAAILFLKSGVPQAPGPPGPEAVEGFG